MVIFRDLDNWLLPVTESMRDEVLTDPSRGEAFIEPPLKMPRCQWIANETFQKAKQEYFSIFSLNIVSQPKIFFVILIILSKVSVLFLLTLTEERFQP